MRTSKHKNTREKCIFFSNHIVENCCMRTSKHKNTWEKCIFFSNHKVDFLSFCGGLERMTLSRNDKNVLNQLDKVQHIVFQQCLKQNKKLSQNVKI